MYADVCMSCFGYPISGDFLELQYGNLSIWVIGMAAAQLDEPSPMNAPDHRLDGLGQEPERRDTGNRLEAVQATHQLVGNHHRGAVRPCPANAGSRPPTDSCRGLG